MEIYSCLDLGAKSDRPAVFFAGAQFAAGFYNPAALTAAFENVFLAVCRGKFSESWYLCILLPIILYFAQRVVMEGVQMVPFDFR